ncbi:MAG: dual specificity protein phosphatase 23 [Candidatus Latescibacterota bacterium]|nr:dual specificity protein phosphatase 23 [Candidatus Latescibacterota bacterium]
MIPNFSWLLPGKLAGSGCPGGSSPLAHPGLLRKDLQFLRGQGIGALVSLTEDSLDVAELATLDLRYLHVPIVDMAAPSSDDVKRFVQFVDCAIEDGLATAVHCRAGFGRTGTLLSCYLVSQGCEAEQALREVRDRRPGSVETGAQEEVVREYGRTLAAYRTQA